MSWQRLRRRKLDQSRTPRGLPILALLNASSSDAGSPDDPLEFAFVNHLDGQVWVARQDGSEPRRLTRGHALVVHAAWSPRGDRMTFQRNSGSNAYVEVINADGRNWKRLAQGREPVWAPDATRIAFLAKVTNRFGEKMNEIFSVKLDGSGLRRLTHLTEIPGDLGPKSTARVVIDTDSALTWAPGGEILFAISSLSDHGNLHSVDAKTGIARKLTGYAQYEAGLASWSPNGRRIVYEHSADEVGLITEIYVMNRDGSGKKRLSTSFSDTSPSWSLGGEKIVFSRVNGLDLTTGGAGSEIFVMDADGSKKQPLTHNPADDDMAESMPDGRISFVRTSNGRETLMVMKADGTDQRPLIRHRPEGLSSMNPIWRPIR